MNRVTLVGRITQDAELKETRNGNQLATFAVAVSERVKTPEGEYEEKTHFFDCVRFGQVERLVPHLGKGTKIGIDGRLSQNRWETQDGQKRSTVQVIVHEIEFMEKRAE